MERQVAATRTGTSDRDGSIIQADITGLIATAYDHYDSRAGDPHLHTHVVIANRVQALHDGRWRTLDSRPMHAAVVALSEYHQAVLADKMTAMFGVGWDTRQRGAHRNPSWDIAGVPEALVGEFASRARDIDAAAKPLIDQYAAKHGRQPSRAVILKLRQQATLMTRPDKQVQSLAELTDAWRSRATSVLCEDVAAWAQHILASPRQVALRADDIPLDVIHDLGRSVVDAVGEKRSTWRHWNLWAEAARQTMGFRFATTDDREAVTAMICEAAEAASIRLTPAEIAVPPEFARPDGSSRFRPRHSTVFTSHALMDAEQRLLDLSRRLDVPTLDADTITAATERSGRHGVALGEDQAGALLSVATSGRVVDVLVGPAGAGKTTALAALTSAWESEHGAGSVVGLAPSAVAAQVLGGELGIPTDNTAKWLADHDHQGATFRAGQLVIIDEASLAGTFTLDRISRLAADAGAKVLLVGDWAQLSAVDAGGAFNLLVHDRNGPPELTDIHRFTHQWERLASLQLRHGRPDVIDQYERHGRITAGSQEAMIEDAYQAWRADLVTGKSSILIADNHDTVSELNRRAREDRIQAGAVDPGASIPLNDGSHASKGDVVITRLNDRRLVAGRTGWVRNGDRWTITRIHSDGSATARRAGYRFGASIVLSAPYVAERLDLGYAVTCFGAQGVTTDTAHMLVTETTTRENLYVGLTRGRQHNHAWIALDHPDDQRHTATPGTTARDVLLGVLRNQGAGPSAHQAKRDEHDRWNRIDYLVAMHQEIYRAAMADRWDSLIDECGLSQEQAEQVRRSDAYGLLCHELTRMEQATGGAPEKTLPIIVASRTIDGADDIAAVLYRRVHAVNDNPRPGATRRRTAQPYILGLVPQATGHIRDDMNTSLAQIEHHLRQRAEELARQAIRDRDPWLAELGPRPADAHAARQWDTAAQAVVAYRERWGITGDRPLSVSPTGVGQPLDLARVRQALAAARSAADVVGVSGPSAGAPPTGITM